MSPIPSPPVVRVLEGAEGVADLLLGELRQVLAETERPLISFATGATYAAMLGCLAAELRDGRIDGRPFTATHLDEYLQFPPDRPGGMVHELTSSCAPLRQMLEDGLLVPVPHDGSPDALLDHEQALLGLGGVRLQFLGIGRNGHLAFNEPGTAFDTMFHVTRLSASTRDDARLRFATEEPPDSAATAGLGSILAAERLVLCAFGAAKAPAVAAMLEGEVSTDCPASVVRLHENVLVVLDRAACADLRNTKVATAT